MNNFDLEINAENIKDTISKNILGRNKKLVMLAKILDNQKNNAIIAIDGKWGSGKTFFVKQFEYIVKSIEQFYDCKVFEQKSIDVMKTLNQNSIIIYYNAWENDDHINPLESIIYKVLNEFPKYKDYITNNKDMFNLFKDCMINFVEKSSLGIIKSENLKSLKSFQDIADSIQTIEEKKAAFNKLINSILIGNKRLILIIDELDRCNPSFAVKLLETIKHFYNNANISIIVSTNNSELSYTIKKFYGEGFDGYRYLNKFYDLIINLECEDIKQYVQNALNFDNSTYFPEDFSFLILKHYNFSLRECNRFIFFYNILRDYIEFESRFDKEENYIVSSMLLPFAVALKIKSIDKYSEFMNKNGQKEIEQFLTKAIDGTEMERWIKELLQCKTEDYKQLIIKCYEKIINGEKNIHVTPFLEAISMLGTRIQIDYES